jgi:hypothetical protein
MLPPASPHMAAWPRLLHSPQRQRVCITARTPLILLHLLPPRRRPGPPLPAQAADSHALLKRRQPLKHERQHAGVPQRLCRAGGVQARPRARDRRHSTRAPGTVRILYAPQTRLRAGAGRRPP